jgi:hypothetical protein
MRLTFGHEFFEDERASMHLYGVGTMSVVSGEGQHKYSCAVRKGTSDSGGSALSLVASSITLA